MPREQKRDQDGIFRRPDSPYWWASFTDGRGRPARQSTRVRCDDDPKQLKAKALRAQWVLTADMERREGPRDNRRGYTFDNLMLLYMDHISPMKRSKERDIFSMKQLFPVFSGRVLCELGAADVHSYIARRQANGAASATINKEIGLFSAALNWARKDLEWDVPNPFKGRRQREPEGRSRWIKPSEASLLLKAAREEPRAAHLGDFIELALHTGMRRGEILGLEWRRVDLGRQLLFLESRDQKNGKNGSVPLNNHAWKVIVSRERFRDEHCPVSPWVFCRRDGSQIKSIKRSFATACRRAGIEDFRPHDLRHTCAAWLVQSGVSIREVAELLRHADIRITMRYAHLSPDNVRAAVLRLDKMDTPVTVGDVSRLGFTLPETHKP